MNALIETHNNKTKEKLQKPDFTTKIGRELLAFYLQTKFKQILNYDKKNSEPLFLEVKHNFISNFTERLVNHPKKRITIGITGESACGKSTICNILKETTDKLNMPISIINADNYFRDISDLIKKYGTFDALRDNGHDVDAPENFRLELLAEHLKELQKGSNVKIPKYLTNGTGVSVLDAIPVNSEKIIIIEGMASMFEPVKNLFDIKIYVEVDKKIRKKRFIERAESRNQDLENAYKHWNYVTTAGKKYIIPTRKDADIILNGSTDLNYFREIVEFINHITNSFEV